MSTESGDNCLDHPVGWNKPNVIHLQLQIPVIGRVFWNIDTLMEKFPTFVHN